MDNQQQENKSHITDSKLYNETAPILLTFLGLLYAFILIIRCVCWRLRRQEQKILCLERQKLERFWKKGNTHLKTTDGSIIQRPTLSHTATLTTINNDICYTDESVENTLSNASVNNYNSSSIIPCSFDSSYTLVVVSNGYRCYHSSILLPAIDEKSQAQKCQNHSYKNTINKKIQTSKKRPRFVKMLINRMNGNYQKKKRQQLLWQWSVAMGYCRYSHGYRLNAIINRRIE